MTHLKKLTALSALLSASLLIACTAELAPEETEATVAMIYGACLADTDCDDNDPETTDRCIDFGGLRPSRCLSYILPTPDPTPDPDPTPAPDPDPDPIPDPDPTECPDPEPLECPPLPPAPEPTECPDPEPTCEGEGTGIVGQGGADSCETDCDCASGHLCIGAGAGSGLCIETCIDDVCDEGICGDFVNNGTPLCSVY